MTKQFKCRIHGHAKSSAAEAAACDVANVIVDQLMMGKEDRKLSNWDKLLLPNGTPITETIGSLGKDGVNAMPKEMLTQIIIQIIGDLSAFFTQHVDLAEELVAVARKELAHQLGADKPEDIIMSAAKAGSATKEGE